MDQFERMEKQMQRTHLTFKRSKNAVQKGKALASYAKTLKSSPEGLAQLLLNFLVGVSPTIAKSKLGKLLRESSEACGMDKEFIESIEQLVEELYEDVKEVSDDNDSPIIGMKLRDLLENIDGL
jgi:hypothetical protein